MSDETRMRELAEGFFKKSEARGDPGRGDADPGAAKNSDELPIGKQLLAVTQWQAEQATKKQIESSTEYRTGKRVIEGGKKGHKGKYGTKKDKAKKWAEWQTWIDERHKKYPSHSFNTLTRAAAGNFHVTQRTIYKRCKSPL